MGAWSSSLYGNDTTCDVRDMYIGFLEEQLSNQEAYDKILETFKEYLADPDMEPLFWYALAETQWKVGRLLPEVKHKALEWIKKDGGLEIWQESNNRGKGWRKTLDKLRSKLETEPPKEKRIRKKVIPFQNPWGLNDIYAYRVHAESNSREEQAIFGKYVLMQKIGEEKSTHSSDSVMRVQIFDRVFDGIPSVDDVLEIIKDYRLLPLKSTPMGQIDNYKRKAQGVPDTLSLDRPFSYVPIIMSAKMEQYHKIPSYPHEELTYICTVNGSYNKQHERIDVDDGYRTWMCSWMWHDFHYQIGRQFEKWQGVEYDTVGDGTFEYPTREQQRQIKAELGIT